MLTTFRRLNRDLDTTIAYPSFQLTFHEDTILEGIKLGWNEGWMAVIKSLSAFLRSD